MTITASLVKELRELTGAGMMECKKALTEVDGDIQAAQEYLRKKGQASADKKASRVAAEGVIEVVVGKDAAAIVEVNCETDFVAKDENFLAFAGAVARLALSEQPADVEALLALTTDSGGTLEDQRKALISKIGENISVRRFELISPKGSVAQYRHGARIGVLVDMQGGDDALGKDIAMHVAAINPSCLSADDVPSEELEKERSILTAQAEQEGKPANIVEKMVDGRIRKYLKEITLLGQPFVKDPDVTVEKHLQNNSASVNSFVRYGVGEGIEKKVENFVDEVRAQVEASTDNEPEKH